MRHCATAHGISRIVTGVRAALLLALSLSGSANASEFSLRVDGLACPFCAFGVEKKLLKVPGVEEIDVLLDEGKIVLTLSDGSALDVAALHAAVDKSGFTLRRLLVRDARGTLTRGAQQELLFVSSNPAFTFRLVLDGGGLSARIGPTSTPAKVVVSGTVEEFDREPPRLVVREIAPLPEVSSSGL